MSLIGMEDDVSCTSSVDDTNTSSDNECELEGEISGSAIASSAGDAAVIENSDPPKKKPFWAPKHIAFIKGLPYAASPDEIKNFFTDCGEVLSLTRQLGDDGRWNGCVFVKFSSRENLDVALSLDGTVWTGNGADGTRFVKIVEHKGKEKKKKPTDIAHTVFVGNLTKECSEEEVQTLFEEAGPVKRVSLAKDGAGSSRGFGHVEFTTVAGKEAALKMSRRIALHGNSLSVRKASVGGSKNKRKRGASDEATAEGAGTTGRRTKRKRAGKGRFKSRKGEGDYNGPKKNSSMSGVKKKC